MKDMSKILQLFKIKTLAIGSLLALLLSLLLVAPVSTATFLESDDDGDIDISTNEEKPSETIEYPYAFGNDITIEKSVDGDVTAFGNDIKITSEKITGSVIVFGGEVEIGKADGETASTRVEGSVKIFAQEVTLKGRFQGEVLVFANKVNIEDASLAEDLVVGTEKLSLKNTKILGDFQGEYNDYKGDEDLEVLVSGKVKGLPDDAMSKGQFEFVGSSLKAIFKITKFLLWDLGIIFMLVIIGVFLGLRKRLEIKEINFNKRMGFDLLTGFGLMIIPAILVILSAMTIVFFFHTFMIAAIIYMLLALSTAFLPIYLANLIKNSLNLDKKVKVAYLIPFCYIAFFGLGFVPYIGSLLNMLLVLATFGFLMSSLARNINKGLTTKKK